MTLSPTHNVWTSNTVAIFYNTIESLYRNSIHISILHHLRRAYIHAMHSIKDDANINVSWN